MHIVQGQGMHYSSYPEHNYTLTHTLTILQLHTLTVMHEMPL